MNDLPDVIEELVARVDRLEQRVLALEHPALEVASFSEQASGAATPAPARHPIPVVHSGWEIPVLGKAMLGIAGAYLLRAIGESGVLPMPAIAAIAIVYATVWLIWAARVPAGAQIHSAIYACASALILAPMLWELTVRFKVLPTPATAGILAAFAVVSDLLWWRRKLAPVVWVANVTAACAAIALMIATRDMAPFVAAILAVAMACEYAEVKDRHLGVRFLLAASADAAIWSLIFVDAGPESARADYKETGAAALIVLASVLFATYATSITIKTMFLRRSISVFEALQTMTAFLLASASVSYFAPPAGLVILGSVFLLLSAASYAAVFAVFRTAAQRRNYHIFGAWGVALFLAGSWLCLPAPVLAPWLGAAAILATLSGVRMGCVALQFHGLACLTGAAVASGLLDYCWRALALAVPPGPTWIVIVVAASAALCYALEQHDPDAPWNLQMLHVVAASLATCAAAALLVSGLLRLTALGVTLGSHHVAFIRTLIACLAALLLAFSGAHWRRMELTRIGYAALVLVAAKLVLEDLRHGHLAFSAASIFLYAVTLLSVPRLVRLGQRL